jgi:hypothetical protein
MKTQDLVGICMAALLAFLVPALPAHAAGRCDELWAAAMDDNVAKITELTKAGVGVNCRDPQTAQTPLMAAAGNGKVESVKLLLSLGADPNVKSAQGDTALDMARDRQKAFSKIPNLAELAKRQQQVIGLLEPRTTGGSGQQAERKPLEVKPADPDMVAKLKLQSAGAAVMGGLYKDALRYLTEVQGMTGVSEVNRAKAWAMTGDVSMRTKDWPQAKGACEKVLTMSNADLDDKDSCKEHLKTLRKYYPELFK